VSVVDRSGGTVGGGSNTRRVSGSWGRFRLSRGFAGFDSFTRTCARSGDGRQNPAGAEQRRHPGTGSPASSGLFERLEDTETQRDSGAVGKFGSGIRGKCAIHRG